MFMLIGPDNYGLRVQPRPGAAFSALSRLLGHFPPPPSPNSLSPHLFLVGKEKADRVLQPEPALAVDEECRVAWRAWILQ